jgi:hypothetical protein
VVGVIPGCAVLGSTEGIGFLVTGGDGTFGHAVGTEDC